MFRLVILSCAVFCSTGVFTVVADVKSCYACAGPQSICVANNRTDFLKMDCTNFQVEGESLLQRTSQPDLLEKFDSQVGTRREGSEIGCVTVTFRHETEDPQERALKSCIPAEVFDQDICEYMDSLVSELGGSTTSCYFCTDDDCNSTIALSAGRPLFILSLILLYTYSNYFSFEYNYF